MVYLEIDSEPRLVAHRSSWTVAPQTPAPKIAINILSSIIDDFILFLLHRRSDNPLE